MKTTKQKAAALIAIFGGRMQARAAACAAAVQARNFADDCTDAGNESGAELWHGVSSASWAIVYFFDAEAFSMARK